MIITMSDISAEYNSVLYDFIKKHEGVRYKAYRDSLGNWTIGIGHLITDVALRNAAKSSTGKNTCEGFKLSKTVVLSLFYEDVESAIRVFNKFIGCEDIKTINAELKNGKPSISFRTIAILDMCYQLGNGIQKFKKLKQSLIACSWSDAVVHLEDSKWYSQTPIRAREICEVIKTNKITI